MVDVSHIKPLIVRGRMNLSAANRKSLKLHSTIELETADRPELALGHALVLNLEGACWRFIVANRCRMPGERVALRLVRDFRNKKQRRAA